MGLTAWAQEQQAKHDAWREINELKRQNAALVAERDYFKNGMAELQDIIDKLEPERDALAAQVEELAKDRDEWRQAMGLAASVLMLHKVPTKHIDVDKALREIRAEAGRAGFVAGFKKCIQDHGIVFIASNYVGHSERYAERVKRGEI